MIFYEHLLSPHLQFNLLEYNSFGVSASKQASILNIRGRLDSSKAFPKNVTVPLKVCVPL